jgi:large subunit ribosomal protein L22
MQTKAIARFIHTSPTKLRRVTNLVRGHSLEEALGALDFVPSPAATVVKKTLSSAAANAENNHAMRKEELWVKECYVDSGPSLRRLRAASMGKGSVIRRRTSHITIVLADREEK